MNRYIVCDRENVELESFEQFSEACAYWERRAKSVTFVNTRNTITIKSGDGRTIGYISQRNTQKIPTVNVIEIDSNEQISVTRMASFTDNPDGNKEAEKFFAKLYTEYFSKFGGKTVEEECDSAIEDGIYTDGGYTLIITHATE